MAEIGVDQLFLEEFVRQMIVEVYKKLPPHENIPKTTEKPSLLSQKPLVVIKPITIPIAIPKMQKQATPQNYQPSPFKATLQPAAFQPMQPPKPATVVTQTSPAHLLSPQSPQITRVGMQLPEQPGTIIHLPDPSNISLPPLTLGKIASLIADPSVISVECPGPNKPVIVNRAGNLQPSSISLTKDEIDLLMKDISRQTKIPLVSGIFKALAGNLMVTAVNSEFVGTRFLLQKRKITPQHP